MNNPSKNVAKGTYGVVYVAISVAVREVLVTRLKVDELSADAIAAGAVGVLAGIINWWKHRK